ncbi:proton-conducting transporter transmembrane domain-containing protein [Salibaculum griseiflavum]|uniref:Probable inorganic carbon transporter subunit DabB n=1 Tax=Salibaculum griseiflavum TaxID=1914409 RepID=A0A2V1P5B9_9RHOB|nr:proton-conducting transporter membrane subunit [Salibaculum griseiflavum]PWG17683.1 oxidoreductase [Salibaculum griseiflavum]
MAPMIPLSILAPLALLLVAALALRRPGRRPGALPRQSEAGTLIALALVALGGLQYLSQGPVSGLLRADAISLSLALLVAFLGWVVIRFSRSYLDGEAREGAFHGQMLATLAAVLILVQAGNLWLLAGTAVAVGLGLKHLLLFYANRPEARRAARKFTLAWHGGDGALILAALLLTARFGTTDLTQLATLSTHDGLGSAGGLAVALLVLAALLKCAAFPLHGWLTEVMEAPTPVSALLHAGIINSGGVILLATAPLVQESPGAMAALVMAGGFTALFGATVMLTQSAVKTALAWSTVAQMGFLMLQCGLGLWPLALLHILAHSLYKAHAFLSSGGAVTAVAALRRPGPVAVPDLGAVLKSFALALLLYAMIAGLFMTVLGAKSPQALALGAILILGVAYLVAQGLADTAPAPLTRRTALASLAAATGYFTFQALAQALWGPALPAAPTPGPLEWALILLALASFGLVALAQALFPLWAHHPAMAGLRVHLANGLYLNALLDRALGGLRTGKTS